MIERVLPLAEWFKHSEWPDALCPACEIGALRADTAAEHEGTASSNARTHEEWDPEWISGLFTCVLRCQRSTCQEIVAAMGRWKVREEYEAYGPPEYEKFYLLEMTTPPLPIIRIPASCPSPVRESVHRAARVVWVDPGAAASRLRVAIELLLDAKGIPRRTRATSGGSLSQLTLHSRIGRLAPSLENVGELLEAVKWIGNQGSHEDSLSVADVLTGAELLEHALSLLYDTQPADLRRRAAKINRDKRVKQNRTRSRRT